MHFDFAVVVAACCCRDHTRDGVAEVDEADTRTSQSTEQKSRKAHFLFPKDTIRRKEEIKR